MIFGFQLSALLHQKKDAASAAGSAHLRAYRARVLRQLDQTIDQIKSCRKRPGVEQILVPGERSHRTSEENQRLGVPVDDATIAELQSLFTWLEVRTSRST